MDTKINQTFANLPTTIHLMFDALPVEMNIKKTILNLCIKTHIPIC